MPRDSRAPSGGCASRSSPPSTVTPSAWGSPSRCSATSESLPPDATYGIVQVRRGVMGDAYSHWTLPRIVGMSVAADILLTGRTFDGREARELGLCSKVVDNAEVLPTARGPGAGHRTEHGAAVGCLEQAVALGHVGRSPHEIEQLETDFHHRLMAGPDAREGVLSYL